MFQSPLEPLIHSLSSLISKVLLHVYNLLKLLTERNELLTTPAYLLDHLLSLSGIRLLLQLKLKHLIKLVEQGRSHLLFDERFRLLVTLVLRLYLGLRVLRVQGFVDLGVFTVSFLNLTLLVHEGLGELLLAELLIVDSGSALAVELLVAKVLLVDVDYLRETTLLDCCLSKGKIVILSIIIVFILLRLLKLI